MLMMLIQKEMMHHILSVRFVALLLMCLLLIPLTLHINYRNYLQNQVNYPKKSSYFPIPRSFYYPFHLKCL